MTAASIYWLLTIPELINIDMMMGFIFLILIIIGFIFLCISESDKSDFINSEIVKATYDKNSKEIDEDSLEKIFYEQTKNVRKKIKKIFWGGVLGLPITIIVGCFIPSKETIIAMYVLPPLINNQNIQELPKDIHEWLLKEIKN